MATIAWEAYCGTPSWTDMGSNRIIFSGSLTNLNTTVASTAFQDGTHLGSGTPGTDQCGTNHVPNVKIIDSTHMSLNGAASAVINDSNLADTSCSFRIHFNDAAAYQLQNGRLYCYDGSTSTVQGTGVDAAAYVKGNSQTTWFTLNSDTTTGPATSGMSFQTANLGGNNSSEYLALFAQGAAADHYYYCAVSMSPETAGSKSALALGIYLEFF